MNRIKNLSGIQAFRANDGTWLREVFHPLNDGVDIPYSVAHASLEKGESSLPHILDHEEMYLILSGVGEMNLDGETVAVCSGDHLVVPGGVVQSLRNTGETPLVFYCLVSPPWSPESDRLATP